MLCEKVEADKEEPQAGDQGCENGYHRETLKENSPNWFGEAGDGCVLKGKKSYKFSSIDKDFLLTTQNILSSFGIVSKIHETKREKYGWRDLYNLTINGSESQRIFVELMRQSVKVEKLGEAKFEGREILKDREENKLSIAVSNGERWAIEKVIDKLCHDRGYEDKKSVKVENDKPKEDIILNITHQSTENLLEVEKILFNEITDKNKEDQ